MRASMALVAAAASAIGLSPAASAAQTAREPHLQTPNLQTQVALGCLLGMLPDGCQAGFANEWRAWAVTTYCTVQYIHRWLDNCWDGPLETVKYLGANAFGDDLYDVNFMHKHMTYIFSPPAPDGKIYGIWIFQGIPVQISHGSLVAITAPANPAPVLYTRPQE